MIRPEVSAMLRRLREVIAGAGVALSGLWMATGPGWVWPGVGLALTLAGAGWALLAWRRQRFVQDVTAPGMVEVDEGQVGYLGPAFGGFVALPDVVELRLLTMRGRRLWRLKQSDGQALLIPVDAAGADRLYDAFASLPGMDTASLVSALNPGTPGGGTALAADAATRVIWRRPGRGVVAG